jgi:Carboxypeptidase regulatory-like domain
VNLAKKDSPKTPANRYRGTSVFIPKRALKGPSWLSVCLLLCGLPALAQAQAGAAATGDGQAITPDAAPAAGQDAQISNEAPPASGSISGAVVDQSGAIVAGAQVTLIRENQSPMQQVVEGDGRFSFSDVAAGPFQLTIVAPGLETQTLSGVLQPGDNYVAPEISLRVAPAATTVRVEPPREEIAQEQIKEQEKQRVLAIMPNFYVSYVSDAVPLSSKQKFGLAWRVVIDPFTFGLNAAFAGAEQADNQFSGYGQGAQGYGKRFGAGYADIVSATFIGSAILPSILKQDPRYFYKGTGSKRSRLLYALANSVICRGDNRHWQPNYSYIAGSLAAGGIANLYYPKNDRNRVGFIFETTGIGIGETAVLDVLQEFFIRKLTPKLPGNHDPSKI